MVATSSSQNPAQVSPEAHLPNGLHANPPVPSDSPTIGMRMNHFCIRVRDPAKSLHFYLDLMGMRTVFTVNGGPLTVYFLGYPQSDRHRQDPSLFSTETVPQLTDGLLELYHVHGSETQPEGYYSNGHTPPYLGFCHLGFTVPSTQMSAMIERFKENQVEFFKNLGEASSVQNIPISEWELARGVGLGEFVPEFAKVNKQIIFVKDPDGYLVELLPQTFSDSE